MSFYNMLSGGSDEDPTTGVTDPELKQMLKDSDEVLTNGHKTFLKVQKIMVADAKAITQNPKYKKAAALNATMLLFAVAWHIIGWLWKGVAPGYAKEGDKNQVWRLWELMRATFGAATAKEMTENVANLHKRWEEGDDE